MRAGIFDPYLDTLGGGERYCFTLAEYLLSSGMEVDFFWEGKNLKSRIEERFGLEVKRINFLPMPKNLFEKLVKQRKYDLLFYVSDGSLPFMFGKRNLIHLQVPFKKVNGRSILNKIKLLTIQKIICNSQFTKQFVDKEFGVESLVIYPPVDVGSFSPAKKENLIISVGRFSQLLQAKRQDVLIKAFKSMCGKGLTGWQLVLAGGSEIGGENYLKQIKKNAKGYPIKFEENLSFSRLSQLYSKARIFWTASGFGIDEKIQPEKVEHFGISAVEAMSAGVVPVLIKKGGFKEIVEEGENGFFWEKETELAKKTLNLIKNQSIWEKTSQQAIKRSKIFSKERFFSDVKQIFF